MLCNPDGNGLTGSKGTEAIGKYYLLPGPGQATYGWIPVCELCAEDMKNVGFKIKPVNGKDDHSFFLQEKQKAEELEKLNSGIYKHKWNKDNLVTQEDMTDSWSCMKCGLRIKRRMGTELGEEGCTIGIAPEIEGGN